MIGTTGSVGREASIFCEAGAICGGRCGGGGNDFGTRGVNGVSRRTSACAGGPLFAVLGSSTSSENLTLFCCDLARSVGGGGDDEDDDDEDADVVEEGGEGVVDEAADCGAGFRG